MTDVRDAATTTSTNDNGPNPVGAFIWYELITPDPVSAKAFYDAVVGWAIEPQPSGEMDYRMISRSDGGFAGGVMRLTDDMASHGARPTWLGYVNVDDVDASASAVQSAGGSILLPAFDIPNVGRIAMVADPFGAPFYIMKPIPPAGQEKQASDVFSPDQSQRVSWNEIQTSDVDGARRFYGDQFGWSTDEFMDMGPNGKYYFVDHHGTRLGALFGADAGQHPHWRFYIRVPSVAQAKAAAEANGGTIHMGPHQVPTGDYIVIGTDPQGAEFALVGGA